MEQLKIRNILRHTSDERVNYHKSYHCQQNLQTRLTINADAVSLEKSYHFVFILRM